MDRAEADRLVKQLATGFETLQDEYQKLFGRHQALERKLATAREQYNEIAKLYGTGAFTTPPLSLSSAHSHSKDHAEVPAASDIVAQHPDQASQDAARQIRSGSCASQRLRAGLPKPSTADTDGVKIWSGPSADPPPICMMPSISESPLEQDFTVEGTPSKLGCPFASMAGKKLSSHAASVLSRYKSGGSVAGQASSTPLSSVSHINGKESYVSRSRSHRASFADPIKAEICGVSDHGDDAPTEPRTKAQEVEEHVQANAEAGVCPIRFLNQHSPEEVATYFENHKHELPRSHEVCVKRYQTNEAQIRELDSKYGNLVSMIQGLGAKHQPMLPPEPEEGAEDDEATGLTGEEAEKVRKWASSVSQEPDGLSTAAQGGDTKETDNEEAVDSDTGRGRQQQFARPLRDIRVGESPSRPWGITVPARYLEKVAGNASDASSQPARIPSSQVQAPPPIDSNVIDTPVKEPLKAQCPFGFDQQKKPALAADISVKHQPAPSDGPETFGTDPQKQDPLVKTASNVAFIAPGVENHAGTDGGQTTGEVTVKDRQLVFTGPVFIGYSAEDAAKILKESGLGR